MEMLIRLADASQPGAIWQLAIDAIGDDRFCWLNVDNAARIGVINRRWLDRMFESNGIIVRLNNALSFITFSCLCPMRFQWHKSARRMGL